MNFTYYNFMNNKINGNKKKIIIQKYLKNNNNNFLWKSTYMHILCFFKYAYMMHTYFGFPLYSQILTTLFFFF